MSADTGFDDHVLDDLREQFARMHVRFDRLETKLDELILHLDGLERHVTGVKVEFAGMRNRFDTRSDGLRGAEARGVD